ncbi:MAG TPA: hypothetical protein O0X66_06680 [Methanocorpusculum sp.]|nr:hypothetical protein [Methanocorpusculum parvum]HJJ54166.1 hypothetical protein [Methanocorpusculum sp.]
MKRWYDYPELLDRGYMEEAILKRRRSSLQIARELGCSRYSVYTAAHHHGLSMEGVGGDKAHFLRRKLG